MEENKKLSPKLDIVFRMLFGEPQNEKATKRMIEGLPFQRNSRNTSRKIHYILKNSVL